MLRNKYARITLSLLVIIIWFVIASIGGPTFGKLAGVSDNSNVAFLPATADSTKVQNLQEKFLGSSNIPAIVVIKSSSEISLSSLANFTKLNQKFSSIKGVSTQPSAVIGPIPSKDGKAVEFIVEVSNTGDINNIVKEIRSSVNSNLNPSYSAYVTGPAGLTADLVNAFSGIDGILLLVAVLAVFIILLLVYRSLILPFLVLLTAMFALCAAILFVYILAKHGIIKLNGQSQGILSILVIGAATDYSLLLISRFKEALHHVDSKWLAMKKAYKAVIEPIAASAATVILALLCLLFSQLNSNRSLGPITALGIAFSFLAAITFLPALLVLFGRTAFWPYKPKLETKATKAGFWVKVSRFVSKHPRSIWITCTAVLLLFSLGLLQIKANGVSVSSTILGKSNAVAGQQVVVDHFTAGSGSPVIVIAPQSKMDLVISKINETTGIINPIPQTIPTSTNPVVVKGNILINATLKYQADSQKAQQTVANLRSSLSSVNSGAIVGGETAINLDTNNTAKADLRKIIPIVLVVILIVLMLLLRAILAPVLLILSVILSFAASLGIAALMFNHVFHFPGADPTVPLFSFIFLVALGVDYNIFLMTRVREESKEIGTKKGILDGLSVTGSVITSAGVVLAATFSALAVIPILFLAQIAFIVAFGVLLDTIVVRSLLIPSISFDIGKAIWWPSKLWKNG